MKKNILFVCVENSCRSQIAEAFAKIHGAEKVNAYSSGSKPSGIVNSKAIESMKELGYDLSKHDSKSLQQIPQIEYDAVITMGCGDACPFVRGKIREDWNLPDPKHLPLDEFKKVRDGIEDKVKKLLKAIAVSAKGGPASGWEGIEGATRAPVIDFHTHLFPNKLLDALWNWFENNAWPIEYKKYVDDLIPILKKEGVERCVHLHYPHKEGMSESLNRWAHELEKKYPDFVIPFGSVHPDDKNPEKILRQCFEDYQMKGLKIHCHVQKVAPEDPRMIPVYEMCEAYKKILLIHCGTGPHFKDRPFHGYGYDVTTLSGVRHFEKIIGKYPNMTFIAPHLGYEEVDEFFDLLKDTSNLYLDTTMAIANFLPGKVDPEKIAQHADRLIFGTDFPNIPYEWNREKNNLLAMKIGKENEQKIFYGNAMNLLDLFPS